MNQLPKTILSIDPGETSGYVHAGLKSVILELLTYYYHQSVLTELVRPVAPGNCPIHIGGYIITAIGEWSGVPDLHTTLSALLPLTTQIVIEDYRIYPHKSKTHIASRVYTAKEIGRVELMAYYYNLPILYQLAGQAKQQWPNNRLGRHLEPGALRRFPSHTKDALRHLLTYIENHTSIGPLFATKPEDII